MLSNYLEEHNKHNKAHKSKINPTPMSCQDWDL